MHALCPEHGYLVRRRGNECTLYDYTGFNDDDSDESDSAEGNSSDERRKRYLNDGSMHQLHSSKV